MNAVIHIITPHINGGLFDAFEYYQAMSSNKDNYLFLVYYKPFKSKLNEDEIKRIFRDKYELSEDSFNNVIFLSSFTKIVNYRFNKVLIVDNHTYRYLDGLLLADEYIFTLDPYLPSKVDYNQLSGRENHHIYNELLIYKE